jgi:pyruvate/2-oxoacid:ferredoxin oxidoreductase alpha subunit
MARVRVFRPFPIEEIRKIAENAENIGVIDRNISFGHEGIFFSETKAALYNTQNRPKVFNFIAGLGGRDVTPEDIEEMIHITASGDADEVTWYKLKKDVADKEGAVCIRGESDDN